MDNLCPKCEKSIEDWCHDNALSKDGDPIGRFEGKCPHCGGGIRLDIEWEPEFSVYPD